MKYVDYEWEITHERVILDEALNIDRLGWKHGDYFVLTNVNGKVILQKVDPLVCFIKQGENNGFSKTSR